MSPTLRKSVLAAVGGGAFAIASALITGPTDLPPGLDTTVS